MTWRPMHPADLASVEALGNAIHIHHQEDEAVFAERFALSPNTCFVLETDTIQGYLIAHPWSGPPPALNTRIGALPRPDHIYLHDLALAPTARGQGHAQTILARFDAPLALIAVSGSAPFWRKQGFTTRFIAPEKLASYGADALYMIRDAAPR